MSRFFFFSSRRRHTRSLCDWSSDVCSSDLRRVGGPPEPAMCRRERHGQRIGPLRQLWVSSLGGDDRVRSEEHTSELQSHSDLVCRLLLEKKKKRRREPPDCT